MSDKNEVFKVIKSVITSQKGGVLLKDLNSDYRNLAGEPIPYRTLGYHSIEDVLDDIPEVQSYLNDDGQRVFTNRGRNCEHLTKLISKQKSTKNNKEKQCNPGFHQNQGKPRNASLGGVVKGKKELNQCNENYGFHMERSAGTKTGLAKKQSVNYSEDKCNVSVRQNASSISRENESQNCTASNFQNNRGWKSLRQFDDLAQHNHRQENSHHTTDQDRVYLYKSSKLLERRETSYCFKNYEPRDLERSWMHGDELQFYEDDVKSGYSTMVNSTRVERGAVSMRSKVFPTGRYDFTQDFPNRAYGNRDLESPIGSHYKFPKNRKSRSLGSARFVPEVHEWDVDAYYDHKYGGRSEMDREKWMDDSNAYGVNSRKIDVISGSLRVTIKNC